MERASRFIVEHVVNEQMFTDVMATVVDYIKRRCHCHDGERRYGNTLFEMCAEVLRTGSCGSPPKTLPPDVKVRLKNKGFAKFQTQT